MSDLERLDAADIRSAVRYARGFFNQDTDLGKALVIAFDSADRYAQLIEVTHLPTDDKRKATHMCGRHGFNPMLGDSCSPCELIDSATTEEER